MTLCSVALKSQRSFEVAAAAELISGMLSAVTVSCAERKAIAILARPLEIANLTFFQHELIALRELRAASPVGREDVEHSAYARMDYDSENRS